MDSDTPDAGLFGGAAVSASAAYRVLARKYRPSSFDDLIGQEPMVRTLTNAFALKRVHQAYILTGVRGVGKTTTARILARAFNYQLAGKAAAPSVHMPELGVHCQAIIDSRHVDVIEIDAASHTGIDNIREIIDNSRYLPVMAARKVYIIDEVHMLSKQAFNGLLKTLEEPPEHVRFIFATTEIEKVPVTVRSRCQRFDLRRIETGMMVAHLSKICAKELIAIEPEALAMIARASEGSVRDALSLLDQAIAHCVGTEGVQARMLHEMLGLADRGRIIDLFDAVMQGDIAAALTQFRENYDNGADPVQILNELAEFVHFVTRVKLVPGAADDSAVTQEERERGGVSALALTQPVLMRAFQILGKGIAELKDSPRPLASAEMALVRLAFAAQLPTPEEALRRLESSERPSSPPQSSAAVGGGNGARPALNSRTQVREEPEARGAAVMPVLKRFEDVVAMAASQRDILLKTSLERDIRLLRFEQGLIEFSLVDGASSQIAQILTRKLQEWTGERWMVAISTRSGASSLKETADARQAQARTGIESNPFVRSVLEQFPGAKIVAVRIGNAAGPGDEPASGLEVPVGNTAADDVGYADDLVVEDDFL